MERAVRSNSLPFGLAAGQGWLGRRAAPATLLYLLMLGLSGWVTPAAAQADLVVTLDPLPQLGDLRSNVEKGLGLTVRNNGNAATPAGRCVKVSFKTSSNVLYFVQGEGFRGNFCSDDLDSGWSGRPCNLGYGSVTGWCKLNSVPARGYIKITLRVRPRFLGGYALIMNVDPDGRIRESNDKNNIGVIPIVIQ